MSSSALRGSLRTSMVALRSARGDSETLSSDHAHPSGGVSRACGAAPHLDVDCRQGSLERGDRVVRGELDRDALRGLYDRLAGEAIFETMENWLTISSGLRPV